MKLKHLFWLLGLSATLAACDTKDEVEPVRTVSFASEAAPAGTRTSLDRETFYWTQGDKIFVKNGSAYVPSDNAVAGKAIGANFYMSGTYDDPDGYHVVYTGNGNPDATTVEIKADQRQDVADDATHIGTDGDCGNALARRTGSFSYAFSLNHKASYLRIAPRHNLSGVSNVVLKAVKVETVGADNLCGTYTFSETTGTPAGTASLAEETNSAPGKAITLTVGDWPVPRTTAAESDLSLLDQVRGYMVIQPGTHTLVFTYTVRVDGETSDRPIVKTVPERNFAQGCYTEVKHILQ